MAIYLFLDRIFHGTSYLAKILIISFIGVHVPMIGAVIYILASSGTGILDQIEVLLALLVATLLGTGATLVAIYGLLSPVRRAAHALNAYLEKREVPALPVDLTDDAGVLLSNVQESVTRLDAALDAANARREETERAYREKFEALSSMSHEIRTPLNHIIGFAEMMSNEVMGPLGGERYKDYASGIGRSGTELLETLQTVLDMSAAEATGDVTHHETISVQDVLRQAIGLTHFLSQDRGVAVIGDGHPGATLHVVSDPRALKQGLVHMIRSMVETAEAGAVVKVGSISRDGRCAVTVRSSGASWQADDLPREYRASADAVGNFSSANAPTGDAIRNLSPVGLRLSLIGSLARLADGTLAIGGADGTRELTITLPIQQGAEVSQQIDSAAA
ncbi:MAG: histidine kinase dimerization/phospho-acceptor domain-containing protein [Minwuia sp.]|nr:histidine kinase dimerization/phospho-acceptor domain-containing protein [Minwuia sp.]